MPPQKGELLGNSIRVIIPLEPVAKGRPKFSVRYNRVTARTPDKTKRFENDIKILYAQKAKGFKFDKQVPLELEVFFGMPIPKSFSKTKRRQIEQGLIFHAVKPDLDNLLKAILDALNGLAWYDDAQIVSIQAEKGYPTDGEPRIELCIRQI